MNRATFASSLLISSALAAAAFLTGTAHASENTCGSETQIPGNTQEKCAAYQSKVTYTGTWPDNLTRTIECAWKPGTKRPVFDSSYSSVATVGKGQIIQGYGDVTLVEIVTARTPGDANTVKVGIVAYDSNKILTQKTCVDNLATSVLSDCRPLDVVADSAMAVSAAAAKTKTICTTYVDKLSKSGDVTNEWYSQEAANVRRAQTIQRFIALGLTPPQP